MQETYTFVDENNHAPVWAAIGLVPEEQPTCRKLTPSWMKTFCNLSTGSRLAVRGEPLCSLRSLRDVRLAAGDAGSQAAKSTREV